MSDIEQQRRSLLPDSKALVARGNGNEAFQGEIRRFADSTLGWKIAAAIHHFTNSGNGGNYWFSRYKLGQGGSIREAIAIGEGLGLWRRHPEKEYWTHNHLTWKFVNTALALQDKWKKRDPKEMTQHDYDQHNWYRSAKPGEPEQARTEGSEGR